jgi:hypothetical protein
VEGIVLGVKEEGEKAGVGQQASNGIALVHHEGSHHEGSHHEGSHHEGSLCGYGMSRAGGVVAVRAAHLLSRLL